MAVGVAAIITAILNLFSSVGDRPDEARPVERCPVGSEPFLRALSGVLNAPVRSGGEARIFNNGDAFFPAMLEAIRRAERSIDYTVYIWDDSEIAGRFFDALTERARAGVPVRVLVDGLGAHKASEERIEALRAAGGRWAAFHSPRFGKLTRLHRRTHRRALIIDGCIGFTGGGAISEDWTGDARDPSEWRDCMVEVRGELAVSLQAAFAQLWTHTTGELIVGEAFYPSPEEVDTPIEDISRHISVISSPSAEAHPMRHLFWFSIQSANERVYITNPYFVPDEIMKGVIKERARAGVDIRVLVPNENIDIAAIRWASQSCYEGMLEAGVRIYEYQPTMIHQKLLVADGVWTIVGSTNMDVRSKELNQENSLGIVDRGFAEQVERTFFEDLKKAREIDLEEWRRRGQLTRLRERFFCLFEEQF